MWIVSKLIVDGAERPYLYTNDFLNDHPDLRCNGGMSGYYPHQLKVTITDTETGAVETHHGCFSQDFEDFIKEYKPYGFASGFVFPYLSYMKDAKTGAFVVATALDIRFLELVKSVRKVPIFLGTQSGKLLKWGDELYRYEHCLFDAINKEKTLFVGQPEKDMQKIVCSLFDAVCYQSDGWFGDTFYLAAPLWSKLELPFAYRVRFKDVKKAKRMIGKALLMNSNSFSQLAKKPCRFVA